MTAKYVRVEIEAPTASTSLTVSGAPPRASSRPPSRGSATPLASRPFPFLPSWLSTSQSRTQCCLGQIAIVLVLALGIFGFRCLMFVPSSPCQSVISTSRTGGVTGNASIVGRRRRLPNAIIFGIRKCGTRALLAFLGQHPDIVPAGKEIHFFDENYEYGVDWYRDQMPYAGDGQVVIEKTPGYFINPIAPGRIREVFGNDVKLILIAKDPVERSVSDYLQLKIKFERRPSNQDTTMAPFEHKVAPDGHSVDVSYKPVRIGHYDRHFQRWLNVFPRDQILVLDGETFVQDPFPALVEVESFLGLEHKLQPDQFVFNEAKGFYCVNPTGPLQHGLREEGCLSKSKGRPHPPISEQVRALLERHYESHIARFFQAIGKRFDDWPTAKRIKDYEAEEYF